MRGQRGSPCRGRNDADHCGRDLDRASRGHRRRLRDRLPGSGSRGHLLGALPSGRAVEDPRRRPGLRGRAGWPDHPPWRRRRRRPGTRPGTRPGECLGGRPGGPRSAARRRRRRARADRAPRPEPCRRAVRHDHGGRCPQRRSPALRQSIRGQPTGRGALRGRRRSVPAHWPRGRRGACTGPAPSRSRRRGRPRPLRQRRGLPRHGVARHRLATASVARRLGCARLDHRSPGCGVRWDSRRGSVRPPLRPTSGSCGDTRSASPATAPHRPRHLRDRGGHQRVGHPHPRRRPGPHPRRRRPCGQPDDDQRRARPP